MSLNYRKADNDGLDRDVFERTSARPCRLNAPKFLQLTKHLSRLRVLICGTSDPQPFQNLLRSTLVVIDQEPTLMQRNSGVRWQHLVDVSTSIYIWLPLHCLLVEIIDSPVTAPTSYRFTYVAWWQLDLCPNSRPILSTFQKWGSPRTLRQEMVGQMVKLEILAQLQRRVGVINLIFWNFRYLNPSPNPPGLKKLLYTWTNDSSEDIKKGDNWAAQKPRAGSATLWLLFSYFPDY